MRIIKAFIRMIFDAIDWLHDWADDRYCWFSHCEICEKDHVIFTYGDFKPNCPNCKQDGLVDKDERLLESPMISYFNRENQFEGYE